MKQSFTLTELYAHRGCYSKEMINYCARGKDTITIDFIINHTDMKLTEKVWFISNHAGLTPHEHDAIALGCTHIAVDMFAKHNNSVITGLLRTATTLDTAIDNCMAIAGTKNQQYAFAIYAACSRDPYDRIYSAARAIELAGGVWIDGFIEYLLRVSKV